MARGEGAITGRNKEVLFLNKNKSRQWSPAVSRRESICCTHLTGTCFHRSTHRTGQSLLVHLCGSVEPCSCCCRTAFGKHHTLTPSKHSGNGTFLHLPFAPTSSSVERPCRRGEVSQQDHLSSCPRAQP